MPLDKDIIRRRLSAGLPALAGDPAPPAPAPQAVAVDLSELWTISGDEEFVRRAYLLILKRECDPAGFISYLEQLFLLVPREEIAARLIASEECRNLGLRFKGLRDAPQPSASLLGRIRRAAFVRWRRALLTWPGSRLLCGHPALRVRGREASHHRALLDPPPSSTSPGRTSRNGPARLRLKIKEIPRRQENSGAPTSLAALHGVIGCAPSPAGPQPAASGLSRLLQSALSPGMTFVDIGAETGAYTLLAAALVGPSGSVIAFEPSAQAFSLLQRNAQASGFIQQPGFVLHRMAPSGDAALDDLIPEPLRVDIVRIGSPGSEPTILRGMRRILSRNPHLRILMQFSPPSLKRAGFDPAGFLNEIQGMGFDIRAVDPLTGQTRQIAGQSLLNAFNPLLSLSLAPAEVDLPIA